MKNNRGITLTSLIIYVIGMVIVIALIATLTSFFYKNINIEDMTDNSNTQYTKFASVFSSQINKANNTVVDCNTFEEDGKKISYIIFSSGEQITYMEENHSIYQDKVKICSNVEDCDFSYSFVDSKYKIKVNFKTKSMDMTGDKAIIYNL